MKAVAGNAPNVCSTLVSLLYVAVDRGSAVEVQLVTGRQPDRQAALVLRRLHVVLRKAKHLVARNAVGHARTQRTTDIHLDAVSSNLAAQR